MRILSHATALFFSHPKAKRLQLTVLLVIAPFASSIIFGLSGAGTISKLISPSVGRQAPNRPDGPRTHPWSLRSATAEGAEGGMVFARHRHAATQLLDGRILVVGGENQSGFVPQSEVFDPAIGIFSVAANLNTPRADHTATRLIDGRVLIAGGRGEGGALNTTEIFDPASGVFNPGPNLNVARAGHSATVLPDGRILFAGGNAAGSIEIYDPSANTFSELGAKLDAPRAFHGAILLNDNNVLIVGGVDSTGNPLQSGEVLDVANSTSAAVNGLLTVPRLRPHLRVLFDGKVQIIGGNNDGSMEIYDPQIQAFGAYVHVLPQGDSCGALPAQLLGTATRGALFHHDQFDEMFDRARHTMIEFADQAIVMGGSDTSGAALSSSPRFANSAATISTDKLDYSPGQTAYITGRGFQPFETVRIKVHEDPHTPLERGMEVVTDDQGNFVGEYLVSDYDLNMRFLVGARGLTSGQTAQTAFTDASPGSLGNYATQSLTGVTASVPPSNVAANVTFSNLARGPGLTGASATAAFSSSGWTTAAAPDANDYYEFTITPNASYQFSAAELRVGLERTSTGPASAVLRTSLDGYASNIGSVIAVPTTNAIFTINLSSVSGLQNSSSAVTLRIYGYGAGSSAGTMRIQRLTTPTPMVGLEVDGTVAASCTPPAVTTDPSSEMVCEGSLATFTAAGSGIPSPTLQWQLSTDGGATFSDIGGATSTTYSFIASAAANGHQYRAVFSNSCGSATTGAATLSVNIPPSVNTHPASQSVTYGTDAIFTAAAAGSPAPTLQWQASANGGGSWFDILGETGSSLTITMPAVSQTGTQYRVVFANSCDTVNSNAATLTVNKANPTVNAIGGTFTYDGNPQAGSGTAIGGAGESLAVTLTYSGAGSTLYGPTATPPSNAGDYQVVAHTEGDGNNNSGDSSPAALTINPAGSTTTIDCSPGTFVYTGAAITPCTATVTRAGDANTTAAVTYTNHTTVGTATADATYPGDANHTGSSATQVTFDITPAGSTTTIDCAPGTFTYTGSPVTPCTATVTRVGDSDTTATVLYGSNTNVGTATADASYPGDANHTGSMAAQVTFNITPATSVTVVNCPTSVIYNGSAQTPCAVSVTGQGLSLSPAANYANNTNAGTATASYAYAGDENHTGSTDSKNFTIEKANAICTVTPYNLVYDTVAHTATGSCSGVDVGGAAIGGSLNLSGTTHTAVGVYNDNWTFTGGTNYYSQSGYVTDVITTRAVLVRYIGQLEWVTSGTSATTAQVSLTASVNDPTGLALVGATADFIDATTNKVLAAGVPVSPVAGSAYTGTANKIVTLSTGQYGADSYLILVKLSSNYENESQPISDKTATVVVSRPAATNEAIGVGTIGFLTSSAGTLRSDIGAVATYVVGMKYNKSGTNPQGKINVEIPRSYGIVLVKSNSISSMQLVSNVNPKKMTIYTKAAVYKVDSLGQVTTIEGNVTLRMDIEDYNTSNKLDDKVGFTVLSSKDSTLFYSNNWVLDVVADAWKTVAQNILTGCLKIN